MVNISHQLGPAAFPSQACGVLCVGGWATKVVVRGFVPYNALLPQGQDWEIVWKKREGQEVLTVGMAAP